MERRSAFQRVCPPDFRKYPPNFRKSLASFLCLCYTTSALCLGMLIFRPVPGGFFRLAGDMKRPERSN